MSVGCDCLPVVPTLGCDCLPFVPTLARLLLVIQHRSHLLNPGQITHPEPPLRELFIYRFSITATQISWRETQQKCLHIRPRLSPLLTLGRLADSGSDDIFSLLRPCRSVWATACVPHSTLYTFSLSLTRQGLTDLQSLLRCICIIKLLSLSDVSLA